MLKHQTVSRAVHWFQSKLLIFNLQQTKYHHSKKIKNCPGHKIRMLSSFKLSCTSCRSFAVPIIRNFANITPSIIFFTLHKFLCRAYQFISLPSLFSTPPTKKQIQSLVYLCLFHIISRYPPTSNYK